MPDKSKTYIIILAGGIATRLRPLSNRIAKPLIDINGKTMISRIIRNFKKAGFTKFLILVGYKQEQIKEEVLKEENIQIEFIQQTQQLGTADALLLCLRHLKDKGNDSKNYFVSAADIIFSKDELEKMYTLFQNTNAEIILSLMKSKDIKIAKGHGNVKIPEDPDMKDTDTMKGLEILDIIEKPDETQILGDYYSLPLYIFNEKILSYLENVGESVRGEKEIQDAIKAAILNGDIIRGINIIRHPITFNNIGKYHLTYLKDIIKMNIRFLNGLTIEGYEGDYPTFIEPVFVHPGVKIGDTVLLGPNTIISKNSELGTFCEISNTIVYKNVVLDKLCKLDWCIIDANISLPPKFTADNCFITKDEKDDVKLIKF